MAFVPTKIQRLQLITTSWSNTFSEIVQCILTFFFSETAVNIGYSSKLLTDQMKVFIVDKDSKEEVQMQLEEANSEILKMSGTSGRNVSNYKHVSVNMSQIADEATSNTGKNDTPPFGIVINGHSLVCLTWSCQM